MRAATRTTKTIGASPNASPIVETIGDESIPPVVDGNAPSISLKMRTPTISTIEAVTMRLKLAIWFAFLVLRFTIPRVYAELIK